MSDTGDTDEIYVFALPEGEISNDFRGDPLRRWPDVAGKPRPTKIKVSELAGNVKLFMQQVEILLREAPTTLAEFEFSEFEVSAGVSASGQLTLLGIGGGEAGIESGLKFVFKKRAA